MTHGNPLLIGHANSMPHAESRGCAHRRDRCHVIPRATARDAPSGRAPSRTDFGALGEAPYRSHTGSIDAVTSLAAPAATCPPDPRFATAARVRGARRLIASRLKRSLAPTWPPGACA